MTSDRLKTALIAILDGAKPDASITVADAQAMADVALPCLSVGVVEAENRTRTISGVQNVRLEIKLRCHSGDGETRAEIQRWCGIIESTINDPTLVTQLINAGAQLTVYDFVSGAGSVEWEDTVLVATWDAMSVAVRTG